jgi:hypothetical protein
MSKPTKKDVALAAEVMEKMTFNTADELKVQLKQMNEKLKDTGIKIDDGYVQRVGCIIPSEGTGEYYVQISLDDVPSRWPEWAYGVAEGALHFNKQMLLVYRPSQLKADLLHMHWLNLPARG